MWARRFVWAAMLQGAVTFALTVLLLYMDIPGPIPGLPKYVRPSVVVAFGSAGTWLTVGYLAYIVFLVVGSAVSALLYHYVEVVLERAYASWLNVLAWAHLLVGNIALGGGFALMMYAGYIGGSAMVDPNLNGGGLPFPDIIHDQYLGPIEPYILTLLIIGAIGPLAGGIGYGYQLWKERVAARAQSP